MEELLDCDYKIITIDSKCADYYNTTVCDFYVNLDEPLRNVYKFNVITELLNIPNNSTLNVVLDPIYINLNNMNRLIGKDKLNNKITKYNINAFDSLIIENTIASGDGGNTTLKNDYNSSDTVYYLNPQEPQLSRFNIKLYDKNNLIIPITSINRFVMKIGVYYNNKKLLRS